MRFDRELLRLLESADRAQLIEFIAILLDVMVDQPDMLNAALRAVRRQPRTAETALRVADLPAEPSRLSTPPALAGSTTDHNRLGGGPSAAAACESVLHVADSLAEPSRRSRSPR